VYTRRIAVVSLLAATSFGMAACTTPSTNSPGSAPTTTTAPQLSAADAFTKALGTLKTTGFDATVTQDSIGVTIKSSVDYSTKSASQSATVSAGGLNLSVDVIEVNSDLWVKADMGPLARGANIDKTKWYKVDASKLKPDALPFDLSGAEPLGIGSVFTSVSNVARTDATHLTGTVDLTKATGPEAPDKSTITDAGAAAAAVPFVATLDDQGRLTELKLTPAAANKDLDFDVTFSNYGSPTSISAPAAADVLPATDGIYQALNGLAG
jgi:uncharacterized protein YaiE (UPF0345 family)